MGKFKTKIIVKTSDVTKLKELEEQLDVNIYPVDSPHEEIKCQFIEINMSTIENKILCKKCKNEVTPDEDDTVVCEKCFIMRSAEQCKIDLKMQLI